MVKEGDKVILTKSYIGWGALKCGDLVEVTSVMNAGVKVWDEDTKTNWYTREGTFRKPCNSVEKIT